MMRSTPLILIVEDNPASREIMEVRLRASDYDVIMAVDGLEGLEMAREHKPDLILLDILMPKMDGLEMCSRIKSDPTLPFMPVIIVTAKTDSKDIVSGLESGGDDYLTKPVDHTALVARVKSMLRIKELHDNVLEQSARLKRQLKTAATIQSLFWPKIPDLGGASHIWADSVPASYVGGDLYDIITMADNSLLVYVADVADKGVPAALIMAALSTIIRSEALVHDNISSLLQTVNNKLYNLAADEGYFATIILVRYWPSGGRMQLIRAGHLYPLWIERGCVKNLPPLKGISLGILTDVQFDLEEITLSPGESLLLFSDGVAEATNREQELYGDDRVHSHIATSDSPPWGKDLMEAVRRWQGETEANDDVTILEIWKDG
ncbi:MAG: SpoIIE family protein phosphatase [Thermodesulfobacteriota bacterium]